MPALIGPGFVASSLDLTEGKQTPARDQEPVIASRTKTASAPRSSRAAGTGTLTEAEVAEITAVSMVSYQQWLDQTSHR